MRLLKRLGIALAWIVATLYIVVFFIPKASFYYAAERLAAKQQIHINHERVIDGGWHVALKDAAILYQGIEAARIDEISLTTLLVYNSLDVSPFDLGEDMASFVPGRVESIRITHSLLAPHKLYLSASGAFGSALGEVDLLTGSLVIDLKIASDVQRQYGSMLRQLKKTKEGYRYAVQF